MKIVEFDPSQFEGKDGDEKFREWLKGLSRVQLLELYDMEVLSDEHWDLYYEEKDSRCWPVDSELQQTYLAMAFKDWSTKTRTKEETFEAVLDRLEPQVQGIQKKLDKLLKLFESNEVTMSLKTALSL